MLPPSIVAAAQPACEDEEVCDNSGSLSAASWEVESDPILLKSSIEAPAMPDWLVSLFPNVNYLTLSFLYDAPFAIFYQDIAIWPGTFMAGFFDPSQLLPAVIANFDPATGGQ